MMESVTMWLKEIFIIILSVTFIEILLPEGAMNKYVKFILSIFVLAVILKPVTEYL